MENRPVAMVTGAARGIGRATARRLARSGMLVFVLDMTRESCAETVQLIEADGGAAFAIACDVTNAEQVDAAVAEIEETAGRLDVLVNNAGVLRDNLLFKMSESDWD